MNVDLNIVYIVDRVDFNKLIMIISTRFRQMNPH